MIIKGGSRGAPAQLGRHLLRTDTNGRVEILELQSPTGDLREALRDWQCLAEGTRGTKGLYHANIDPEARYAMSAEQWQRAVEVLEEKLGFQGQPRAVVLHEKHGRSHIHVVWQRTDVETMTLRSDSHNYRKHEEASLALEMEFGHEHVPGKHAKRDRQKQPELPKAEINHAEWQQSERTGVDPRERKEMMRALYEQSDSGIALKAALEEKGFMLAKGDRRDFVLVDIAGETYSLGREIGVPAKELRDFMADVDRDKLPSAEQARTLQTEKQPAPPDKTPPPEPPSAAETPALSDARIAAIRQALADHNAAESRRQIRAQESERTQTEAILEREISEKLADFDAAQQAARDRYLRDNDKRGIDAVLATLKEYVMPAKAADEALREQEKAQALLERLEKERNSYLEALERGKALELDALDERHAQARRELAARHEADLARNLREEEIARRLLLEMEEQRRRDEERARDGPDHGPPRAR